MQSSPLPRLASFESLMADLDGLDWRGGIAFASHGARIGVRVNDASIVERLRPYLPWRWEPAESPIVDDLYSVRLGEGEARTGEGETHRVYCGPQLLVETTDLVEMLEQLAGHLEFSVAVRARDELFVHAGVVGWGDRAIVIPGRSRSGKTTLVEALVRAGATYYSDEFAVIDDRGRVHPFPRPLSIRQPGGAPPKRCRVEELGGRAGSGPLPIGLVVLAKYRPGARWRPRAVSPGEAVLGLLDNTVPAQLRPDFAMTVLRRVATGALTLQGRRGESQTMVQSLIDEIVTGPVSSPTVRGGRYRTSGGHRAEVLT